MPKKNHPTFGDVQRHTFITAKILKVYIDDGVTPEADCDTADIQYEGEKVFYKAPIRYHCYRTGVERENGAIVDGGYGFSEGDEVIVMARVGQEHGKGEEYDQMFVVAHKDGVKACLWDYVLIRMSAGEFIAHEPPYGNWSGDYYSVFIPDSHVREYCIVWDARLKRPAIIMNPVTKEYYVWPVTMEDLKPILDDYAFVEEELFELQPQGDMVSEEAGFTPQWKADGAGNLIRGDVPANEWWTSFNINGNPISNLFYEMEMAVATDAEGVADGTFQKAVDIYEDAKNEEKIAKWIENSPVACNRDVRENDVKGSDGSIEVPQYITDRMNTLTALISQMNSLMESTMKAWNGSPPPSVMFTYNGYKTTRDAAEAERAELLKQNQFIPWTVAHDIFGEPLKRASSHWQLAYGEDEIWVCAKQTYNGLVISSCDSRWKFDRHLTLPPVVSVTGVPQNRLLNGTTMMGGVTYGYIMSFADISFALASDVQVEEASNIFSYATLKRLIEGCYRHTENPAMRSYGVGSWRMRQLARPNAPEDPVYNTALNTRYAMIDVWDRYDNWMNTFNHSCASPSTDRTWWFKSYGMQWRITSYYLDTPIGSMFYDAPLVEVALWNMASLTFSTGNITARRDIPGRVHFTRQTKQTERVMLQIYVVQRQGVSLWQDPTAVFAKQEYLKGPYDSMGPDKIKWVTIMQDGVPVSMEYDKLLDEEKESLLDDRTYLRSEYEGEVGYEPPSALNNNRNEVEIMAACDTVASLKVAFGRAHPIDQERDGRFEKAIAELVAFYYEKEGIDLKTMSDFNMEARAL